MKEPVPTSDESEEKLKPFKKEQCMKKINVREEPGIIMKGEVKMLTKNELKRLWKEFVSLSGCEYPTQESERQSVEPEALDIALHIIETGRVVSDEEKDAIWGEEFGDEDVFTIGGINYAVDDFPSIFICGLNGEFEK